MMIRFCCPFNDDSFLLSRAWFVYVQFSLFIFLIRTPQSSPLPHDPHHSNSLFILSTIAHHYIVHHIRIYSTCQDKDGFMFFWFCINSKNIRISPLKWRFFADFFKLKKYEPVFILTRTVPSLISINIKYWTWSIKQLYSTCQDKDEFMFFWFCRNFKNTLFSPLKWRFFTIFFKLKKFELVFMFILTRTVTM